MENILIANNQNCKTWQKVIINVVKYSTVFAALIFLSMAKIYDMQAFGAGLYIALVFLDLPIYILSLMFIAAEVIATPTLVSFFSSLICVAVIILFKFVRSKTEKSMQYLLPIFTIVSRIGNVIMVVGKDMNVLMFILSCLLSLGFMYACKCALKPLIKEKLQYKLTEIELLALGLLLTLTALGMASANIFSVPTIGIFAAFSIFLAGKLKGISASAIVAFCFGLGLSLKGFEASAVSAFVFIAIVAGVFADAPKILNILSGIIGYIIFAFYFNVMIENSIYWISALSIGGILYAIIPKAYIKTLKDYFFSSHERAAVRYMINKNRADIGNELMNSALIFDSMSGVLVTSKESAPSLMGSLENKHCAFCDNYEKCKSSSSFSDNLNAMLRTTFEKGRMTVADLPDSIMNNCIHLGKLISATSEIEERRKGIEIREQNDINARNIISTQLKGISSVLRDMAKSGSVPLKYDEEKERILLEELNYCAVSCAQCLLSGENIALIVRSECLDRQLIEKVCSKIMKAGYMIVGIDDTILAGFSAIMLSPSPKYNMVFGYAAAPKIQGEKSGDTHSFIKISNSRFMIALCDGMGSGKKAESISDSAITLVESFYKAGFDNELVLQSVNKFLSLNSDEGFSALDICVVDLENASADIIKLGCPPSYIKRKEQISKIEGSSLPLGAVDYIRPTITSVDLSSGDMLFFMSDGVSDCFEGDKLASTINNMRTVNPQIIAQEILEQTLSACNGVLKDDSTVIAAKLIQKA